MNRMKRLFLLGLLVLPACATTDFRSADQALHTMGAMAAGALPGQAIPGDRRPPASGLPTASITGGRGYGDAQIRQLLARSLDSGFDRHFWLPDHPAPTRATEAIGVVFVPVSPGASNRTIEAGLFQRVGGDFRFVGKVSRLFGRDPRDPQFLPDRIELTSDMPQPGDLRCCPTGEARWSIDRGSLVATRLR